MNCFGASDIQEDARPPRPREAEITLWSESEPPSPEKDDRLNGALNPVEDALGSIHEAEGPSKQLESLICCSLISSGHPAECS